MSSHRTRRNRFRLAFVSIVLALVWVLPTGLSARASQPQAAARHADGVHGDAGVTRLTVTATAFVRTEPDSATITASYAATAETAAEAEGAVRRGLEAVGEALARRGHVVTVGYFSIYPHYDYREETGSVITGFEARRQLEVAVRDVDRVGEALELLLELGVNEIHGINYGLVNEGPARREAIRKALADAREQAEAVAELGGWSVAGVLSVSIDGSMQTYIGAPLAFEASASLTPSPATVHVTATVEYLLEASE